MIQNEQLLKKILVDRKFLSIRILFVLTISSSFIIFFYVTIPFSCQLMLFQNVIMVFIIVSLLLAKLELKSVKQNVVFGFKAGCITGSLVATVYSIVNILQYYVLGHRELVYKLSDQSPPPLNIDLLFVGIGSTIVIWILLVMLSSLSGMIAAFIYNARKPVD